MAGFLDIFSVGFDSKELQEFNDKLKQTRSNLDKAEEDVKALEKELDNLDKAGGKDSDTFKAVSKRLNEAKDNVKKFENQIKTMEGRSEFQLQKLRQNFMKVVKAVGALAAVTATVKRSMAMYEEAEQIGNLAQKANVAVESLQRLGNAAKRFGGNTEASASTITSLQTKETKEKIVKAGIKVGATPEQTLENIAAKMETLKSDAEKINLADSLGIDEGTTRLLIEGVQRYREELKRTDKYKLYTKEDIERMRDYRQIQADIRMGIESIQGTIARMLLPALTTMSKVIRGVTDWLAEHEGAVKIVATLVGIVAAVGAVIGVVKGLHMALTFLLANPVVLTIIGWSLAITAIIAVIQDFITWLQGGESALKGLWETGAKVFDWLKAKATGFIDSLKNLWDNIPDPIKKMIGLSNPITGTMTMVNIAKEQIAKANNNPLNSVPQGAIQNYNSTVANNQNRNENTRVSNNSNKKTTNIGTINIQTQATNGAEVARDIQSISQFDDGIVA